MTEADPNILATGMFQQLKAASEYIATKAVPRLDAILSPDLREQLIMASLLRTHCWMSSLNQLGRVEDFQAIAASTRSLLELCVDVVLLSHGNVDLAEKAHAWTISSKFKMCERLVKFFQRKNRPIPNESIALEKFYLAEAANCAALRLKYWNGTHPDRWTGASLLADCGVADKLEPYSVLAALNMALEEFYESQIRRINWTLHGAGYASIHGTPRSFAITCGLGYKWSSDLSILIAELTMRALKLTQAVADIQSEWSKLKTERYEAMWTQFNQDINRGGTI
jgi:hypothetical protein